MSAVVNDNSGRLVKVELETKEEGQTGTLLRERLPKAMRWLGGLLIAAASVAYLVQGWNAADSISRYYGFLAFISSLSFAGLVCAKLIKEEKGARTFLSISAAVAPALFCQMGALIYSLGALAPEIMPDFLVFKAASAASLITAGGISALVLIPVFYTGFSVLLRPAAGILSVVYALTCATLLLPVREAGVISLIFLGMIFTCITVHKLFLKNVRAIDTWEGGVSQLLLIVPSIILAARTGLFYGFGSYLFSAVVAGFASLLFFKYFSLSDGGMSNKTREIFGSILFVVAWAFLDIDYSSYNKVYQFYMLKCFPVGIFLSLMSVFCKDTSNGHLKYGAMICIGSLAMITLDNWDFTSAVLLLIFSVIALIEAYLVENKAILRTSICGLVLSLIFHISQARFILEYNPWLTLAVLGTAVVLGASYLERNLTRIVEKVRAFQHKTAAWS